MKFDTKYEWSSTNASHSSQLLVEKLNQAEHEKNAKAGWALVKEMYVNGCWHYWWKKPIEN